MDRFEHYLATFLYKVHNDILKTTKLNKVIRYCSDIQRLKLHRFCLWKQANSLIFSTMLLPLAGISHQGLLFNN